MKLRKLHLFSEEPWALTSEQGGPVFKGEPGITIEKLEECLRRDLFIIPFRHISDIVSLGWNEFWTIR